MSSKTASRPSKTTAQSNGKSPAGPGLSKAGQFMAAAEEAGWTGTIKEEGDTQTVVVTRDTESIKISWRRGACADGSTYQNGDYVRTLRNAAACLRQLTSAPIAPPARKRPVRKARPTRTAPAAGAANGAAPEADPEEERPKPRKRLPFKVSSPADDILKAVIGKEIFWGNSISGGVLSARVLNNPNQKQLRIEYSPVNRKRILTFAAAGEGYRSVYVESILELR